MVCRAFLVLHRSEFPACCKSMKVPPCHVIEGIMASSRRRLLYVRSGALSLLFYCVYSHLQLVLSEEVENCQNLRLGQYKCNDPKIDESTQEPENCRDMTAWVECLPAPNISCRLSNGTVFRFSGDEVGFNKSIPCRNEWLFLQSGRGIVSVSGLARSRSLLPGISCSGTVEVLHCWFLWDWHTHRLHIDRHADRGSSRRIELHCGLLRRPSDPSVHHQRDFQEATSLSVSSPGRCLHLHQCNKFRPAVKKSLLIFSHSLFESIQWSLRVILKKNT
uniref:Uncharacterized protein n=1 Tax=Astatotilapia calliptera TaxID=8154 RepID=A0AAX7ULM6_ASTCA